MCELRRSHHGPQADELWMVCFYTELRGRAPKGMEQIDPLETILALESTSPPKA